MSKTKLLLDVVEDIRSLGDSLQALAESFGVADETVVVTNDPKQSEQLPFDDSEIKKPKVTLEDVRAVLARKSQAWFMAQIQSIIKRFDASKLSEVATCNWQVEIQLFRQIKVQLFHFAISILISSSSTLEKS